MQQESPSDERGGGAGGGQGGEGGALLLPAQFTASSHSRGAPSNPEAGNGGRGSDSAGVSTLQEVGRVCEESLPCPPRCGAEAQGRRWEDAPREGERSAESWSRDCGAGAPQMGSGAGEPWVMKMCCPGRPWLWAAQTQPGLWTLPPWWLRSGGLMPHPPPADRGCQEGHCGHVLRGHTEGSASRGARCFSAADLQEEGFPGGSVVKKDGAWLSGLQILIPLPKSPRGPGAVIPI